jgi:hypothetical protein
MFNSTIYNWNIVESDVEHDNPNPPKMFNIYLLVQMATKYKKTRSVIIWVSLNNIYNEISATAIHQYIFSGKKSVYFYHLYCHWWSIYHEGGGSY